MNKKQTFELRRLLPDLTESGTFTLLRLARTLVQVQQRGRKAPIVANDGLRTWEIWDLNSEWAT